MEKYDRVVKKKEERTIDANEIRITSMGRARNYITYAMTLLQVLYLLFDLVVMAFLLRGRRYGL